MKADLLPSSLGCQSGIYAIRHAIDGGKIYVGSAVNLKRRFKRHANDLQQGSHHSSRLQRSFVAYGLDAFTFEILEYVPKTDDLIAREQFWIDRLQSANRDLGFNILPIAGSHLGARRSVETRAKMSSAQTGRKFSTETRAKMSADRKGVKVPAERVARRSASQRGLKRSAESRAKMSAAQKGKVFSAETREKIRACLLGRKHSQERRDKNSAAQKGHPVSTKTREKISSAKQGHSVSAETRSKLSDFQTGKKRPAETIAVMTLAQAKRRSSEKLRNRASVAGASAS